MANKGLIHMRTWALKLVMTHGIVFWSKVGHTKIVLGPRIDMGATYTLTLPSNQTNVPGP